VKDLSLHTVSLESRAKDIGKIAGQTNLSALNAAIEAVGARNVGRGFAVVAVEDKWIKESSWQAKQKLLICRSKAN
jgi:methyl-accepting chemotaxis protein